MQQRLLRSLDQVRQHALQQCVTKFTGSVDVIYETGFRHGRVEGVELTIQQMLKFYQDKDSEDSDL